MNRRGLIISVCAAAAAACISYAVYSEKFSSEPQKDAAVNTSASEPALGDLKDKENLRKAAACYELKIWEYLNCLKTSYPKLCADWTGCIEASKDKDDRLRKMYESLCPLREDLINSCSDSYEISFRLKIWDFLFASDAEHAALDDWNFRIFKCFCSIDLPWIIKNADYIYNCSMDDPDFLKKLEPVPKILKDNAAENGTFTFHDIMGIRHLLYISYNQKRADDIWKNISEGLTSCGLSFKGRDVADIGCGIGPLMPILRTEIGADAKLYGIDINKSSLLVMSELNKEFSVSSILCKYEDCCLKENSIDAASLVGVHMGSGLEGKEWEKYTKPWLVSICRALRKDGILAVHDGRMDQIDQGLEEKVESCGFKKLSYKLYEDRNEYVFIFKKKD